MLVILNLTVASKDSIIKLQVVSRLPFLFLKNQNKFMHKITFRLLLSLDIRFLQGYKKI